MRRWAIIEGEYRYALGRVWDEARPVWGWWMLNPSKADAEIDDPTVTVIMKYSRSFGAGGIEIGNLAALRATDPKALLTHPDPIGPKNMEHLRRMATTHEAIIAAWGNPPGRLKDQISAALLIAQLRTPLFALGVTTQGNPWHPLRKKLPRHLIPYQTPVPWQLMSHEGIADGRPS